MVPAVQSWVGPAVPAVQSRVQVLVVEAVSLRSSDRNSLGVNPYCKLNIGKEKAKTKIIERSHSPVWKESFSMGWTEGNYKLDIQIQDWKATGNFRSRIDNSRFDFPNSTQSAWDGLRSRCQS